MDKAEFERTTKDHVLTIKLDQGVYRHLVVRKPGTGVYGYEIVTYPGHLVISGDMGDNIFERLTDMFEFFRGNEINPRYWFEKIQSDDQRKGAEVFSEERFGEWVYDRFEEFCEDNEGLSEDQVNGLAGALEERLRSVTSFEESIEMVHAFNHRIHYGPRFDFHHSDGCDPFEFSPHYIWRCYAIQHAIKLYDAARG